MDSCTYASSKASNAGSNNDNPERLLGLKVPSKVVVKIFHDNVGSCIVSMQMHASYIDAISFCVTYQHLGGPTRQGAILNPARHESSGWRRKWEKGECGANIPWGILVDAPNMMVEKLGCIGGDGSLDIHVLSGSLFIEKRKKV